jgi:T-complex protein 1 subunit eta
MLKKCSATALNSKLIASNKEFFSEMIVTAVEKLEDDLDRSFVGIKKVTGGSITDSFLVEGVAFKKTFSYAGFEQQPKQFKNPQILILNLELELKSEKENAEIRLDKPEDFQKIVDAEWSIIYDKLDKIIASGVQIVLSKLPIGDLATQYFADKNIFCAGRVPYEDLLRVAKATGGVIQTTVNGLTPEILGTCGEFEEVQLGGERYNLFKYCTNTKSATIVLRGGAEQFIEEAERSLNDAVMIVKRAIKAYAVVAGGGAIEMELSRYLREQVRTVSGKQQLVMNAFAKALEVIPKTLSENSGLDSTEILNKLRQKHAKEGPEGIWWGVDVLQGKVGDLYKEFVWEPELVRVNVLTAATEAACVILSIDETVKNPKSEQSQHDDRKRQQRMRGMGRGGPQRGPAMGRR